MFAFKVIGENKDIFGDQTFSRLPRFFGTWGDVRKEGALKKKMTKHFRCCDDDGITYFWGVSTDDETENAFIPLDYLGEGYGCTCIEYKDENGNYQML